MFPTHLTQAFDVIQLLLISLAFKHLIGPMGIGELVLVFVDFALVALRRFLAIFLKTYPREMRSITLESSVA